MPHVIASRVLTPSTIGGVDDLPRPLVAALHERGEHPGTSSIEPPPKSAHEVEGGTGRPARLADGRQAPGDRRGSPRSWPTRGASGPSCPHPVIRA
jgi:hypothetical protein